MELHRCRFVEWLPAQVTAMALNDSKTLLAVGRRDAQIELWNTSTWHMERRLVGTYNIQCLTWLGDDRLFSGGLDSFIIEWDINLCKPKKTQGSYGGPVWAIVRNPIEEEIAVGCEDGCIRFFSIDSGEILLKKSLPRQKGRVLSLSWKAHSQDEIVSGGDATIRLWKIKSSQAQLINVPYRHARTPLVWCVYYLSDKTIVSGDSLGYTSFWDSKTGTVIDTFKSHDADILSLAVSASEDQVYSSGVDTKITLFQYLSQKRTTSWVATSSVRKHSHDVKSLVLNESRNELISGGVEGRLWVYDLSRFGTVEPKRISPFPHYSVLSSSNSPSSLLLSSSAYNLLSIHRLGKSRANEEEVSKMRGGSRPELERGYEHLMDIKTKNQIVSFAISADGKYIACSQISSKTSLSLWRLDISYGSHGQVDNESISIKPISLPKQITSQYASQHISFTKGNELLISSAEVVYMLKIASDDSTSIIHLFDSQSESQNSINSISISSQYLAVSDYSDSVSLFDLNILTFLGRFPQMDGRTAAMAFSPEGKELVVVTGTKSIYVFDVEKRDLHDWSVKWGSKLPKRYTSRAPTTQINFVDKTRFILSSSDFLWLIDFSKAANESGNFQVVNDYKSLLGMSSIDEGKRLILVERPWTEVLSQLPEVLYRRKFNS